MTDTATSKDRIRGPVAQRVWHGRVVATFGADTVMVELDDTTAPGLDALVQVVLEPHQVAR